MERKDRAGISRDGAFVFCYDYDLDLGRAANHATGPVDNTALYLRMRDLLNFVVCN